MTDRRFPVWLAASGRALALSRREFLASAAAAAAAGTLAARPLRAIPSHGVARRTLPTQWIGDTPPLDALRTLAEAAMDAARQAGADFADMRIGVQRYLMVLPVPHPSYIGLTSGYGIRASVNGSWSFQRGELLAVDAVAAAARTAVEGARIYAKVNAHLSSVSKRPTASAWAPAPVVTGTWHAPMEIDPFTIPLDDHHRAFEQLSDVTTTATRRNVAASALQLEWRAETRLFASTTGSLTTQSYIRGGPDIRGGAVLPDNVLDLVPFDIPNGGAQIGGFETALRTDWMPRFMAGFDDAIRWRELPVRDFDDVGRFPLVLAGSAMGALFGATANLLVDGDRLAGLERSASGTTYLTPANDVLHAADPQFSPLLTARVDRASPSSTATGWDDEGVTPESYTFVRDGRVVDYHTTRETAPLLADWYAAQGRPLRAHGTSVAESPTSLPMGGSGHVYIDPAKSSASLEDLYKEISHGFVFRAAVVAPDSALTGGMIFPQFALEIRRGVPVARTMTVPQFVTKRILSKQLVALGDASTVRTADVETYKGIPWQRLVEPVTAPAALFKDVDITVWDR